jgi:hypothetical protein
MRFVVLVLAALVGLGTVETAWAQATRTGYSPEFQNALVEDYGPREGDELRGVVENRIAQALARRGVSSANNEGLTIDITIVDAIPNRPTRQQIRLEPGLDMIRSISVGGAEFLAVLRDRDGNAMREITHRRYDHSLLDAQYSGSTWHTARRAAAEFAEKVATAYVGEGG